MKRVFLITALFSCLCVCTMDAQEVEEGYDFFIRLNAMFTSVNSYGINPEIDMEFPIKKTPIYLAFGSFLHATLIGDGIYWTMKERELRSYSTMAGMNYYLRGDLLNIRGHCLGLSGGYSMLPFVHKSSAPDKLYSDHGVMVRLSYDYRVARSLSLGAVVQYMHYFKGNAYPNLLSLGLTLNFAVGD